MKTIIERFLSESPNFFKRLKAIAMILSAHLIALIFANSELNLEISEDIISICKYLLFICIGITGTSQLTKK